MRQVGLVILLIGLIGVVINHLYIAVIGTIIGSIIYEIALVIKHRKDNKKVIEALKKK